MSSYAQRALVRGHPGRQDPLPISTGRTEGRLAPAPDMGHNPGGGAGARWPMRHCRSVGQAAGRCFEAASRTLLV